MSMYICSGAMAHHITTSKDSETVQDIGASM
jgi:hypothetical protein